MWRTELFYAHLHQRRKSRCGVDGCITPQKAPQSTFLITHCLLLHRHRPPVTTAHTNFNATHLWRREREKHRRRSRSRSCYGTAVSDTNFGAGGYPPYLPSYPYLQTQANARNRLAAQLRCDIQHWHGTVWTDRSEAADPNPRKTGL